MRGVRLPSPALMKKIRIILILLIAAVIIIITVFLLPTKKEKTQVCLKNTCFNVEIANTVETRERGLMFRKNLSQNEGMLFIFPEEKIYPFWMKNTLINLDIIWIDQNKEVVFISQNNQPCDTDNCPPINPGAPAKYVLEINAGLAEKIGLKDKDKIEIYTSR